MRGDDTYEFGYDTRGGRTGARFFRHEEKGTDGRVRGQYGFVDANDDLHVVLYVTDALGHRIRTETHKIEGYGKELSNILEQGASTADVKDQINMILREQSSSSPSPELSTTSSTLDITYPTFDTTPQLLTTTQSYRRTTRGTPLSTEPYFSDDDEEPSLPNQRRSPTRSRAKTLSQDGLAPSSTLSSSTSQGVEEGSTPAFPLSFEDLDGPLPKSLLSPGNEKQIFAPAPVATRPPAIFPDSDSSVFQPTPSPDQFDSSFLPPPTFPMSHDSGYSTRTPSVNHITTSSPNYLSPTRTSTFHTFSSSGYMPTNSRPNSHFQGGRPLTRPTGRPSPTSLPLSLTIPLTDSLSDEEYQELRDYLRRILSSGRTPLGDTVLQKLDVKDMVAAVNGAAFGSFGMMSEDGGKGLAMFLDRSVIDGGVFNGDTINGGIIGNSGGNSGKDLDIGFIDGGSVDGGVIGEEGRNRGKTFGGITINGGTTDVEDIDDSGLNGGKNLEGDIIDGGTIDLGIINLDVLSSSELEHVFLNSGKSLNRAQNSDSVSGGTSNSDSVNSDNTNSDFVNDGTSNSDSVNSGTFDNEAVSGRNLGSDDTSTNDFSQPRVNNQWPNTAREPSLIDQLIRLHKPNYPQDLDQQNPFDRIANTATGENRTPEAIHYIPSPDLSTDRPTQGDHILSTSSLNNFNPIRKIPGSINQGSNNRATPSRKINGNTNTGDNDASNTSDQTDIDIRDNFDGSGQGGNNLFFQDGFLPSTSSQKDLNSAQDSGNGGQDDNTPSQVDGASGKTFDNYNQGDNSPATSSQGDANSGKAITSDVDQDNTSDASPRTIDRPRAPPRDASIQGKSASSTSFQNDNNTAQNISNNPSQDNNNVLDTSSGRTLTTSPDVTVAVDPTSPALQPDINTRRGTPRRTRPPSINLVRQINSNQDITSNLQARPVAVSSLSPNRSPVFINSTVYVTTTALPKVFGFLNHRPRIHRQQGATNHPFPPPIPRNLPASPPHGGQEHQTDHDEDQTSVVISREGHDLAITTDSVHTGQEGGIGLFSLGNSGHLPLSTSSPGQSTYATLGPEVTTVGPASSHSPDPSQPLHAAAPHGSSLPPIHISTFPPPHISASPPPHGQVSFSSHITTSQPLYITTPAPAHGSNLAPPHGSTTPSFHPFGSTPGSLHFPPHELLHIPAGGPLAQGAFPGPPHRFNIGPQHPPTHAPQFDLSHSNSPENIPPVLHHGPPLIPQHNTLSFSPGRLSYQQVKFHNHQVQHRAGRDTTDVHTFVSGSNSRRR
ncbi:putative Insect cuticle protein domain-containing protein 15 [Homarus americanus]|uniref:Putative Insect cuticle protein domain-containing protein 15 n=1 Tax=Homarus americanus TaxID=6706 RepID=A0A8J5NBS1_HOMAM|nr:putative Insect cuticle protein domain-containing protein 15 [Homarus americanus]